MNTIARNLSIFVLMAAAATTALTIGATTTFAASNTHTHNIQLMGKDDSWASSFTHTPVNWTGDVGSDGFGGFNSAQYGGFQPHHHHSSTNTIADSGGNLNSTAGSGDIGDFNPHHHSSMIADYNGDNSNSTAGSDDRGGFSSTQYGSPDSQSHHHKDSTPNSSWMWPTHHTGPDEVDIS
jgi:hypothetical protein